MLKFEQFISEVVVTPPVAPSVPPLSDVARETSVVAPGAPVEPTPAKVKSVEDMIRDLVNKHKNGDKTTGEAKTDALTLKTKDFRAGQIINIKMNPDNAEIRSQIVISGKKKFYKIVNSNIDFTPFIGKQDQEPPKDTGLVSATGAPLKAAPAGQKVIYFQTFADQKDKRYTWFYFYDNTNFITNNKAPILFSRKYTILSVE